MSIEEKSRSDENDPVLETRPDREAMPVDQEAKPRLPFMVVGVGASAGGLEAYTEFLKSCRSDSGMAFVFIQHLSPKHESLMAELLSKHTSMPVRQVEDQQEVIPNHVYVIRPGYTMTIKEGHLNLGESATGPGHRRPVDDFFKSLAEEQRERSVAVILSGTGSNGTAGAAAIKAVGGLCIAQDPDTAKFSAMPRSLIDSGMADSILKPQEMFGVIAAFARHPYANGEEQSLEAVARRERSALGEVLAILRARVRHDFSGYKKPTIIRRIQRRMSLIQVAQMADYVRALRQNPTEVHALSDDLMIHVTGFFRDPDVWDSLYQRVITPMVAEKEDGGTIRVWVTACSSGEEAYTLGMLLVEASEAAGKHFDIKIFATDTAERSLSQARAGIFPGGIESEITPARLDRFFEKDDSFYRVRKDLRELVVFAPQNVLQDPPFSRLDICTCRNFLIYIEADVQRRVLQMLHFGLRDGGTLLLGNSETVNGAEDLFEPLDKRHRLYRRIGPTRHGVLDFPISRAVRGPNANANEFDGNGAGLPRASIAQMANQLLLEQFTPAAVVVDRQGRIVYYHGDTSRFLDQPRGEPTRELLLLAREEVRGTLRNALAQAFNQTDPVHVRDGTLGHGEHRTRISITIAPLDPRVSTVHYLVGFSEQPDPPPVIDLEKFGSGNVQLTEDLRRARKELQSTVEELQTSNEEMKASHEEITSVNEELQSANEELETSKEELQSLNEELTTVNAQLQSKMEELERTTNDLSSLLSSTDIAVIFLDTRYRIRRFTPAVRDLMDLIPADVGRPLSDLARKFTDPNLAADAETVLHKLVPLEREIASESGRWYMRRVLPYRTSDNRIDGVVVTFVDITERLNAIEALRQSEARYRLLVNSAAVGICETDTLGRFIYVNDRFCEIVGRRRDDILNGASLLDLTHPDDRPIAGPKLERMFSSGDSFAIEKRYTRPGREPVWVLSYDSATRDVTGKINGGVAVTIDDTERHHAQLARQQAEERLRLNAEASGVGDWELALPGRELYYSPKSFELLGLNPVKIFTFDDHEQAIYAEDRGAMRDAISRALDPTGTGTYEAEFRVRQPDGTLRWVESRGRAEFEVDGDRRRATALRGTMHDITERKQVQTDLAAVLEREQAARAEAESANDTKDQFLANASHELRTPLAAILLWSNLLKDNPDSKTLQEGVDSIEYSARSQQKLIEDLLDSARISVGKIRLELKSTDLAATVASAVATIRPAAEAKGLEIATDFSDDVGEVLADADRLRQVVWNLLSNAVKFSSAGGKIDVGLWRRGPQVEIRITDNGQGIAPDALGDIFTRFRQADPTTTRRQGGLGLGLAISRQLIELHGGSIAVASDGVGKGSTFTVMLPLARRVESPPPALTELPVDAAVVGSLPDVRLLLLEDDIKTRDALAMLLRKAGAIVEAVDHVDRALAAIALERPQIIVSDIGLPDRDGHSFMRQFRAEKAPGAPRVPALALSAFDRPQDRMNALESGFDHYLPKPVQPHLLIAVLRRLLKLK